MATFAVVNFTSENAVEVVPVSWLTNNDEDCRWPPYRPGQTSAAIRNMESPHATWAVCKCRVLYTTDNYEKARLKSSEAVDHSDLQTESENDSRKRLTKPSQRFASNDIVSSDSDDESASARKLKKAKLGSFASPPCPPQFPTVVSLPRSSSTTPQQSLTLQQQSLTLQQQSLTLQPLDRVILTTLEEVKTQLIINNNLIQAVLRKLEASSDPVEALPESLMLPMKTEADVHATELALADSGTYKALVSHLGSIGGRSFQETVRRVMSTLFSRDLATQFNWLGRGNKRAFSSLKLNECVIKAVRRTSKETESEIITAVKDWLKYAKDREGGRKAREARRSVANSNE